MQAALDAAFDGASYGANTVTTAALIVHRGEILAERYADGFDIHTSQRTWSVAKSLAATIIGGAVQDGLLEVNAPARMPEWAAPGDPRADITLENLLHMSSGLYSGAAGNRTDEVYFGGSAIRQRVTQHPLAAPPGARWALRQ